MRLLVPVALLALVACSSSTTNVPDFGDAGTSGSGAARPGKYQAAPARTIDTARSYAATMVTSKGTIALSLDAKAAPVTVNNFVFLARERYYDGLTFHRVEKAFVIQGGDPSGDGTGGPGYTIPDEDSGLLHADGALAMAKSSAPDSAGSQFYITLAAQPSLDGNYTVFGRVTGGRDVVAKIARGDTITSVTVAEQ